jgi:stage II sporulation protein E
MATKENITTRAHRLREELEQSGRLILKAPALIRGAECGIRFLLGAVLAGAEILGGYAPFGVALVGASGSGVDGMAALLGACFGYLSFQGLTAGLRYVAAAILTYAVAFAFFDLTLYRKSWFMPLSAAIMCACTGFVYLSDQGWRSADVIFFLTEVLLAGGGAYFFRIAFSPWLEGREEGGELTLRQTVSLLVLGGALLITLSQITLFGEISLGRLLAALAVMLTAYRGGMELGAAVGIAAGMAMDLSAGGSPYYSMTFAFSGLMTGIFWKQGKLFAALAYVLADGVAVLWTWESGARISLLYEVFIASVIFLLLPDGVFRRVGALLTRTKGRDAGETHWARSQVKRRLEATAQAFQSLHQSLRDSFRTVPSNDGDIASVFDRTAARVCRGCALRDACWQRDYISTFNAINDATPAMVERGRGVAGDFPLHFTSRCLHFPEFLAAANEELSTLLCRRQYQSRLQESRQAVCGQYGEVDRILSQAAAELGAELVPDPAREKRLRGHLAALGLDGRVLVYYDGHGHLRAELPDLPPLRDEGEREKLSRLLNTPLLPGRREGGKLLFDQAEPLRAVAGVAARRRDGEEVSGDSGTWFRREDGKLYLLLCDGMGSGPEANRESKLAVDLLERFLQAGVEPEPALKTLNGALALRWEATGGFTTVDLLELDLFTGAGALYKFGAAPTYLRKKGRVSRVAGGALPAGLATGESVTPDLSRLELEAGDLVVLVSDGVTSGEEDGWLREAVRTFQGEAPKDLALQLVSQSQEKKGATDDRTAIVLRLERRQGAGGEERDNHGHTPR